MTKLLILLLLIAPPYSVTTQQGLDIAHEALQMMPRKHRPQLDSFRVVTDPCPGLDNLASWYKKAECVKLHIARTIPDAKIIHAILPPIIEPGPKSYIGGLSRTCQGRPAVSVSNAIEKSLRTNEPRLEASAVIIAHELGHTLGADHDDRFANIMHSNATRLFLDGHKMAWTKKSIRQMNRCQNPRLRAKHRRIMGAMTGPDVLVE